MDLKTFTENAAKYVFFFQSNLQYSSYQNVNIQQTLTHIITFIFLQTQVEAARNLPLNFKMMIHGNVN